MGARLQNPIRPPNNATEEVGTPSSSVGEASAAVISFPVTAFGSFHFQDAAAEAGMKNAAFQQIGK